MARERRGTPGTSTAVAPEGHLASGWLAGATDDELAATFRSVSTLPLDTFMNAGGHLVDLPTRTIFNDEYWKGWLPRGLALRDIFTRLSTGYAKRFWKQGNRYLGETLYLDGRIKVKHSLEEFTLDRATNDLDPGTYILLRYTDPVFEHLFYDVMKAPTDGVIVYGGYSGRFPDGRRGFTGVLMRRYSFGELGLRDHEELFKAGPRPRGEALHGVWRLDAIATSNHAVHVGTVTIAEADGQTQVHCEPVATPDVVVPSFLVEHFTTNSAARLLRELRVVDDETIVGTWHTEVSPLYARFVSASPGLFHRDREKGSRRYTLRHVLTKEVVPEGLKRR
ncbi:hypothetical protein LuPra_02326 [Luteitalea pratensis]|uniref:Uncharacterized protein n=1 Tax=Luteitalea pratensis TaxID=1855912 RepID=A0A143PLL3_LUTPR|nr:hypothetical protein [Luteitalea pratensis]AMY09113.1 hypothetical protein LuPra_02326 [Luteitalea pratensis]